MEGRGVVGLDVFTNLGTRFGLVALIDQTFEQLKGTLEEIHFSRFPQWGEIAIAGLWIEVFSNKYRIVESTLVGVLYKQPQGSLEVVVSLYGGGPGPVQAILPTDSWTNFSNGSTMLPSENDAVTVSSSVNMDDRKTFFELSDCEAPDLRLNLYFNRKPRRHRLGMLYSNARDKLARVGPVVLRLEDSDKHNNFHDADPMQHRRSRRNHSANNAHSTSDADMDRRTLIRDPGYSQANSENSLYTIRSRDDEVSTCNGKVSRNDRTIDHEEDLPMLKVNSEEHANAIGTFGTVMYYSSLKDDEEARIITSDCVGVGFGNQLNCGTSLRQNLFLDDIPANKSRLAHPEENALKALVPGRVPRIIDNDLQFDGFNGPSSISNSVKESILAEKSGGRFGLKIGPDSLLWMKENGGWMLKSCSGTKSVLVKKNSRKRKRKRAQVLRLKELNSASVCSEETKLGKNGSIDIPLADCQGQCTLRTQTRKPKKMKCVLARKAENLYIDAQVKTECDTGSVENENFNSKNVSAMTLDESKGSPFLTEIQGKNLAVAKENPTVLIMDISNNIPHLDTQKLLGNSKKKIKSQKIQRRPTEALERTYHLKDGSNHRPFIESQTPLSIGAKKTKSQKKRRKRAKILESACQLKEDGNDIRALPDSQTLLGNTKKKRKSQSKRKSRTKTLKSNCQLKENDRNYRPLHSWTLSGYGMKKIKSRKKHRSAKASESTCQKINISEEGNMKAELPILTTKVLSFSSKMYRKRANAASVVDEETDPEAVGYIDYYARKQATNSKRKRSKKKRNALVLEPHSCCGPLTIDSDNRTFGEKSTDLKDACSTTKNNQSKVERERKFSHALLRMTFIKFPKLVRAMACPIWRHKSKQTKA